MSLTELTWPEARRIASNAAIPLPAARLPLADCHGLVLAESLSALVDLPPFATSAMDGWAVAGPGPWKVTGRVLAGQNPPRLGDGQAVEIATGARLPPGASSVLRSERGVLVDGRLEVGGTGDFGHDETASALRVVPGSRFHTAELPIGADIRPQGQESRRGETLLPASTPVTPAVLGLAAAAGYDVLAVHERPRVALIVIGDELATSGLPDGGHVRDALGPMLSAWLRALGVEVTAVTAADDAERILATVASSPADLVVTTGGTARGPVDHVHAILAKLGARLLVDGVAVRPGHPMVLADHGGSRQYHRFVVGLPGNPLAAVAGFVTLVRPLLLRMSDRAAVSHFLPLRDAVAGHPSDTRLVPVSFADGFAVPLRFAGPAMLRGLALADGLAVVPPGAGAGSGQRVEVLPT